MSTHDLMHRSDSRMNRSIRRRDRPPFLDEGIGHALRNFEHRPEGLAVCGCSAASSPPSCFFFKIWGMQMFLSAIGRRPKLRDSLNSAGSVICTSGSVIFISSVLVSVSLLNVLRIRLASSTRSDSLHPSGVYTAPNLDSSNLVNSTNRSV